MARLQWSSWRSRGSGRARARRRAASARAGRALDPREHPGGPPRRRSAAALEPRARRRAGSLARRRHRGLRPARRRGLPAEPAGRAGAGRADRARLGVPATGALAPARAFPTTSTPACPTSPASPAIAGCARCAPPGGRRRSTPSATPTRAACPRCGRRSPTTSGRVRGAAAEPEQMLICTGFAQAFSLLCRWLAGRGVERVALEDPGWHPHRLIVEQAGLEVVPVPVDAEGIRVDALERTGGRARSSSRPPTSSRPASCSAASAAPPWSSGPRRASA